MSLVRGWEQLHLALNFVVLSEAPLEERLAIGFGQALCLIPKDNVPPPTREPPRAMRAGATITPGNGLYYGRRNIDGEVESGGCQEVVETNCSTVRRSQQGMRHARTPEQMRCNRPIEAQSVDWPHGRDLQTSAAALSVTSDVCD